MLEKVSSCSIQGIDQVENQARSDMSIEDSQQKIARIRRLITSVTALVSESLALAQEELSRAETDLEAERTRLTLRADSTMYVSEA